MARPSKVARLDPEIREAIATLRRSGRTIDEILAHIRSLGVEDIARSSLGEHILKLDQIAATAMRDRSMAEALVAKFGHEPDDKVLRANIELMQGLLFRMNIAMRLDDENVTLDAREIKFMSETMRNLASASKIDTERVEKIERRAAAKALKDAEAIVTQVAARHGVSAEAKADLKAQFLGLAR